LTRSTIPHSSENYTNRAVCFFALFCSLANVTPGFEGFKYHLHILFFETAVYSVTLFSCTASHLVAVLPRIDERQEDDFFRSASESDSFSSGEEDGVLAPDLREVKKKSKSKTDSQREKPPISYKRPAKPPEPVAQAETQEEHFVAVKAENLFDISEGEEEGQDGDNGRFFQPEDNNDESEDEDAKTNSEKLAKKRRDNNDENASESEEEMDEKEKSKITKTKAVTTAVSTFLNHKEPGKESKEETSPEEAQPTEEEDQRIGTDQTKEEEQDDDDDDDDDDESEEEENNKKDKEEEEEEEEEPRVEFTGAAKPEVMFNVLCV